MALYKNKYRVETTRLAGWDYSSPGYYFITICARYRECLFGEIISGEMVINNFGRVIKDCWENLPNHYKKIKLDEFIIMPNHIHGILVIISDSDNCFDNVETGFKPVSTMVGMVQKQNKKQHGLFEFVRALKTFSARRINKIRNTVGTTVWQSRFYDRIIREEKELFMIREYIQNNPAKWEEDENYIARDQF